MKYRVIPLLFAANEHFKNTIRFAVEFREEVDPFFVRELMRTFGRHGIDCTPVSEERFCLADCESP